MKILKKYGFGIVLLLSMLVLVCGWENKTPLWVAGLQEKYNTKDEFIDYWYFSDALLLYEKIKRVPQEVIIAKMWFETHGGQIGSGKYGALFGIKGSGIRGYDSVDREHVTYQSYNSAWKSISHFCDFINNDPELLKSGIDTIDNDLYYNRFLAWKKLHPSEPDYVNWLLALQVHPMIEKSKLAYAACGCKMIGEPKNDIKCYYKRKQHAQRCIQWIHKNLTRSETNI